MFDNEPSMDNCSDVNKSLLASPIISLGPHGLEFNSNRLPVSYFNTFVKSLLQCKEVYHT